MLHICKSLTDLEKLQFSLCIRNTEELVKVIDTAKSLRILYSDSVEVDDSTFVRISRIVSQRKKLVPFRIQLTSLIRAYGPLKVLLDKRNEFLELRHVHMPELSLLNEILQTPNELVN